MAKIHGAIATALILAGFCCNLPAYSDIIVLADGRKITGSVVRQGNSMVITSTDGQTITVAPDMVTGVMLTSDVSPADAAAAEWTRVSAQIKKAGDMNTILDLHHAFLEKYSTAPAATDAKNSLAEYQKIAASDPVKFHGHWMPRAQVELTRKKWSDAAATALADYRAGDLQAALTEIKNVLVADSSNLDAMAIGGLVAFHLGNPSLARAYFVSLAAADPSSILAENNLAVICFQQKLQTEELAHYLKALQTSSDNRLVLDNCVEALNSYTGDKTASGYKTLQKIFEQAEAKAEAALGQQGLFRFGSTWVTAEQEEKIKADKLVIQDAMLQLDAKYHQDIQTLAALDAQIKQFQNDAFTYAANVTILESQIARNDNPLLDSELDAARADYNRIQKQIADAQIQRAQTAARIKSAVDQAAVLKARLAAASTFYTGTQRIMDFGEDQNPPPPAPVPPYPATQPARPTPPSPATKPD